MIQHILRAMRALRSFLATFIAGLTVLGIASNSFGQSQLEADYYVDANNGDDVNNLGTDFSDAFETLQKALNVAGAGDVIFLADGLYYVDAGITPPPDPRDSTFAMLAGMEIYGGFTGAASETVLEDRDVLNNDPAILSADIDNDDILDDDNAYHVVIAAFATSGGRIDGVTITMGFDDDGSIGGGAGLFISTSGPGENYIDVVNCTFTENQAGNAVTEIPARGGAIFMGSSETGPPVLIYNCTFDGNIAVADTQSLGGGAIYQGDRSLEIMNCLFINNEVISITKGLATYCGNGGAINAGGDLSIVNCTFSDNMVENADVGGEGGAIYYNTAQQEAEVLNCILWDNRVGTSPNQIVVKGQDPFTVSYSDIEGGWTGDGRNNLDQDPDFINGYRLDVTSPCIDAGDDTEVLADTLDVDDDLVTTEDTPELEFRARIVGSDVDMGCYECSCPADFDEDGAVDFDDFTQLLAEFGSTCPCETDLDGDNDVDFDDFTNLLANFGPCPCEDPGLTLLQEFLAAGLDEDDYDDYLDIMENGTQTEKDCWTAWVDHYLNCSPSCAGSEVTECDDPFLTN